MGNGKLECKFQSRILSILKNLEITAYDDLGNVDFVDIGETNSRGRHFEYDIIAKIDDVGILIETTIESTKNKSNMEKKCKEFSRITSSSDPQTIIDAFTLTREQCDTLIGIKEWRFLYICPSTNLFDREECIDELEHMYSNCYVLNAIHIQYLEFLSKHIGKYGTHELKNKLNIDPDDDNYERFGSEPYDALEITGKRLYPNSPPVTVYATSIPVTHLLNICRVDRYGSLKNWRPEIGSESYQRLLNANKLKNLRKVIDKNRENTTFPNSITTVINHNENSKIFNNSKLKLVQKYGYMDVIDGQHRLFAFAKTNMNHEELEKIKLMVVAIKYDGVQSLEKEKIMKQLFAKIFVDINANQSKVKSSLISLLLYDVMGDLTPHSLAAKLIKKLNKDSKILSDSFVAGTYPLKSNKQLQIETIIKSISPLFTKNCKIVKSESVAKNLIIDIYRDIENFFKFVKETFSDDWNSDDSYIFTSNYFASFCCVYVLSKLEHNSYKTLITNLKKSICKDRDLKLGPNNEIFYRKNTMLPKPNNLNEIKKMFKSNIGTSINYTFKIHDDTSCEFKIMP